MFSNLQPNTFLNFQSAGVSELTQEFLEDIFYTLAEFEGPINANERNLGHFGIHGNPLKCGCDVAWIVNDPKMLKIIDWDDIFYR